MAATRSLRFSTVPQTVVCWGRFLEQSWRCPPAGCDTMRRSYGTADCGRHPLRPQVYWPDGWSSGSRGWPVPGRRRMRNGFLFTGDDKQLLGSSAGRLDRKASCKGRWRPGGTVARPLFHCCGAQNMVAHSGERGRGAHLAGMVPSWHHLALSSRHLAFRLLRLRVIDHAPRQRRMGGESAGLHSARTHDCGPRMRLEAPRSRRAGAVGPMPGSLSQWASRVVSRSGEKKRQVF